MTNTNTRYAAAQNELAALRAQGMADSEIFITLSNRNCASGTFEALWGEVGAVTAQEVAKWGDEYSTDGMMTPSEFEWYISK